MANPSKDKGTRKETAAARWLQANGWPACDRQPLRGNRDQGDLLICDMPDRKIVGEVKYRDGAVSEAQLNAWMDQTTQESINAGADLAVLIVARKGVSVASWGAYMVAADWLEVLAGESPLFSDAPWMLGASLQDWSHITQGWADS